LKAGLGHNPRPEGHEHEGRALEGLAPRPSAGSSARDSNARGAPSVRDLPQPLRDWLPGRARAPQPGRLWIERAVGAHDLPLVDVVDERGLLVRRIRLPAGRRLAGFGRASVYLVRKDDVDLQYLERYRLPTNGAHE